MHTGAVFIKKNSSRESLECEVRGLKELKTFQDKHHLNIPKVFELTGNELHLERIKATTPIENDWATLAVGISKLHKITAAKFGFEAPNFIGRNKQINTVNNNWGDFFIKNRLLYQINLIKNELFKNELFYKLDKFKNNLSIFLNSHNPTPCLLHGDLWSGNVMFDKKGPWLIDPAVYYGDHEVDISMTKMFGGFDQLFYSTYQEEFPPQEGNEMREKIYNLYHYLNHYNIFGDGYLKGIHEGFAIIESF